MSTRIHFFRPAAAGLILSLNLVILLAGCAEVPESIRDRVPGGGAAQPHVQVFQADPKVTFAAAKAALDQMGYKFTGGGPAEGRMEAMSEISPGDWPGSAHQFSLHADFGPAPDGQGTEVTVRMTEVIEADSTNHPGQGTETALMDTPLVDVFFHGIQQNLTPQKP